MALKASSPRVKNLLEQVEEWRDKRPVLAAIDVLTKRIPKLLYFASYDRMDGNVSLEHLRQVVNAKTTTRNEAVFLAFLDFAGTTMEELEKQTRYEALKAQVEAALANHPIGRFADPREIAAASVWLLSDKASFVTGTAMSVDGAYTTP